MSESDDLLNILLGQYEERSKTKNTYLRAPFGMAGGKYASLENLHKHIPVQESWVDHFGGTGVVSWSRPISPRVNVYNDRYSGVVAFYKCLKNSVGPLLKELEGLPYSRELWIDSLDWENHQDSVKRAAQWYYLMKYSVMGKRISFARTTRTKASISLPNSLSLFRPIHGILQSYYLENLDFDQCAKDYDAKGVVHYFDPPYLGTDCDTYAHKWTTSDLERLLRRISSLKGFVALSGYEHPMIDQQSFWTKRLSWETKAYAEVMGKDNDRREKVKAVECLWIKE